MDSFPPPVRRIAVDRTPRVVPPSERADPIARAVAPSFGPERLRIDQVSIRYEGAPKPDGIEFWGGSFVSDPGGRILVKGGTGEKVLVADVDLGKVDVSRTHWPFLRDRRIDAYAELTKRYLD